MNPRSQRPCYTRISVERKHRWRRLRWHVYGHIYPEGKDLLAKTRFRANAEAVANYWWNRLSTQVGFH